MEPKAKFLFCDGEQFAYRMSSGVKQDILLVHGLAETSKFFWREFFNYFGGYYRVTAIDLRGHGLSVSTKTGYSSTEQADVINCIIRQLNLHQPILIGHSLGGIIALRFAIRFPKMLRALIVYACPMGGGIWKDIEFIFHLPVKALLMIAPLLIPYAGRFFFKRYKTPNTLKTLLLNLRVFYRNGESQITDEMINEAMQISYDAFYNSIWTTILRENILNRVSEIIVPTLFIRGEHDPLMPRSWMLEAVQKIESAEFREITDASHLALIERPYEFTRIVQQFLDQVCT